MENERVFLTGQTVENDHDFLSNDLFDIIIVAASNKDF